MKITKILGLLLLVGLIVGMGGKLLASLDYTDGSPEAIFTIVVAGLLVFLAFWKIVRE